MSLFSVTLAITTPSYYISRIYIKAIAYLLDHVISFYNSEPGVARCV